MDKIVDFPDRESIEQEAAEWLIKLDGESVLRPEELQALREWMHRSPLHRDELINLSEFWRDQSLVALPISLEELYYETSSMTNSKVQMNWSRYQWLAVSAALGITICLLLVYKVDGLVRHSNDSILIADKVKSSETNYAYFATAIGQQRTVTLSDGSVVFLNTNSQIRVDYQPGYRNILLLQGEAHFDVSRQPDRPFQVYAGRGRVQALGTAFTIYYRESDDVDITVTEGKVALSVLTKEEGGGINKSELFKDKSKRIVTSAAQLPAYYVTIPIDELGVLEAGQATSILVAEETGTAQGYKLDKIKSVSEEELERRAAWRSGLLIFTGNSLEEVVNEISRYTTLSIEIIDPELKKIRIGGRFSIESTDALFNALEANFGLQVTHMDYNHVQISSASKHSIE